MSGSLQKGRLLMNSDAYAGERGTMAWTTGDGAVGCPKCGGIAVDSRTWRQALDWVVCARCRTAYAKTRREGCPECGSTDVATLDHIRDDMAMCGLCGAEYAKARLVGCPECGSTSVDTSAWVSDDRVMCAQCRTGYAKARLRPRADNAEPEHTCGECRWWCTCGELVYGCVYLCRGDKSAIASTRACGFFQLCAPK